jgi:surface protein
VCFVYWDGTRANAACLFVIQFYDATVFNQPVGGWNVSSVYGMSFMVSAIVDWNDTCTNGACLIVIQFVDAKAFNQPIGGWNVSSVTIMSYMVSALCVLGWCLS